MPKMVGSAISPEDGDEASSLKRSDSSYSEPARSIDSQEPSIHLKASDTDKARARKRKVRLGDLEKRAKRMKLEYNEKYGSLLDAEMLATSKKTMKSPSTFEDGQYGISIWTAEEKQVFFRSLDSRGRHNARQIALDVGSKSEPEVFDYICLLDAGLRREYARFPQKKLFKRPLESSHEIGSRVDNTLKEYADTLGVLHQKDDEEVEQEKYGDVWLLTPKLGRWADRRMRKKDEDDEIARKLPCAQVLDLQNFLDLSKDLFMNSNDPELNWRSHADKVRSHPSIFYSAFSDIHAIMIDVTKKIICSAIFISMSRSKAIEAGAHHDRQRGVRRSDVEAAVRILDPIPNAKYYWPELARRCKLQVYDENPDVHASSYQYSYEEIEESLSGYKSKAAIFTSSKRVHRAIASTQSPEPSDQESSLSESPSEPHSEPSSPTTSNSSEFSDDRDARLEVYDQAESKKEESKIWRALGFTSPPTREILPSEEPARPRTKYSPESGIEKSAWDKETLRGLRKGRQPRITKRDEYEGCQWTEWINYRAEWEGEGGRVPEGNFENSPDSNQHDNQGRERGLIRKAATDHGNNNNKNDTKEPNVHSTRRALDNAVAYHRVVNNANDELVIHNDHDDEGSDSEGQQVASETTDNHSIDEQAEPFYGHDSASSDSEDEAMDDLSES